MKDFDDLPLSSYKDELYELIAADKHLIELLIEAVEISDYRAVARWMERLRERAITYRFNLD